MNRYTINRDRLRIIGPNDTEKKNFNGVLASIKAIHPNSNVWKRSMKSLKREFRSSLSAGGTAEPIPVTPEMQELGARVFDCFPGCVWTGIDVLREGDDIYIGECNSLPLTGVIEITGHNFYIDICNYIISQIPINESRNDSEEGGEEE